MTTQKVCKCRRSMASAHSPWERLPGTTTVSPRVESDKSDQRGKSGITRSGLPAVSPSRRLGKPGKPPVVSSRSEGVTGHGGRTAGIYLDRDVLVPMRDGVRLATDVYRPEGSGRYPVVLERTPNGKQRAVTSLTLALLLPDLVERGYAVVVQDMRGRYNSAGDWEPFRYEINDGFDTVRWAATQPWSNGRVGTVGVSYSGAAQLLAAMAAPSGLTTMVPAAGGGDPYEHWLYGKGGSLDLCFSVSWTLFLAQNAALRQGLVGRDLDELQATDAEVERALVSDPDTARLALRRRAAIVARAFARRPVGDIPASRWQPRTCGNGCTIPLGTAIGRTVLRRSTTPRCGLQRSTSPAGTTSCWRGRSPRSSACARAPRRPRRATGSALSSARGFMAPTLPVHPSLPPRSTSVRTPTSISLSSSCGGWTTGSRGKTPASPRSHRSACS